jgi:Zinc-binding loop region of homing endonuclease
MESFGRFMDHIIGHHYEPDAPDGPGAPTEANGCWTWLSGVTGKAPTNKHAGGYGVFELAGHSVYAHNLSHLLFNVLDSDGQKIADLSDAQTFEMLATLKQNALGGKVEGSHLCHNRRCVNPSHIQWESHSDNMKRSKSSKLSKGSKLTQEQAADITTELSEGT